MDNDPSLEISLRINAVKEFETQNQKHLDDDKLRVTSPQGKRVDILPRILVRKNTLMQMNSNAFDDGQNQRM